MAAEANLVIDLAVILIAAGVFTIISKALKQPLILGYIIAGFLVGPHMPLFPNVTDVEAVNQWSQIGIIFLLFSLGLEFSFKKLLKVGSSALITAGTICVGMFMVGLVTGNAMGWSNMERIFLGGLLSMSSTTIIIKAYDDMGLKNKPYAPLIFGTLVVEDLIAVVLLVLLSTLAVSNQFNGGELLFGIAKLIFFIILWFLVGMFLIPTLLKKAHRFLSDEILLIVSIGLCFLMVTVAEAVGFSSALGAFLMGSMLSETMEGERISKLIGGIKNLFGAIFFVSVGMMVDPSVIAQHWQPVLILTITVVSGILIFATLGALMSGQGLNNAVHTGFSLAQLGEFAFIIAGLGGTLGVMRGFIYPVIIAVFVITTFTTPYLIKAADPVYHWLHKVLPAKVIDKLEVNPSSGHHSSSAEKNQWKALIKSYFIRVLLYGVMLLAISIGSNMFLKDAVTKLLPDVGETAAKWICLAITYLVMFPFIYGMASNTKSFKDVSSKLVASKQSNKWPILFLVLLKIFIAAIFLVMVLTNYLGLSFWAILVFIAALFGVGYASRKSVRNMSKLEATFISNLNEREMEERKLKPVTNLMNDEFDGYDVHLEVVELGQNSEFVGQTLKALPLRKVSGVNIVKIMRGDESILIPSSSEILYPFDRLLAVGTTEQIACFKEQMESSVKTKQDREGEEDFVVQNTVLNENSFLKDKTLKDLKMRQSGCMIVSVKRGDRFITNPKSDFVFLPGDTVWVAGGRESCQWFLA